MCKEQIPTSESSLEGYRARGKTVYAGSLLKICRGGRGEEREKKLKKKGQSW
jgi:hypothetical protein